MSIDWVNATFRVGVGAPLESVEVLLSELGALHPGAIDFEAARGLNGYESSVHCARSGARVAWGGAHQRGSVLVMLPGGFFAGLDADGLLWLRYLLEVHHAKLTRVDLACDWFDGLPIETCVQWWRDGVFNGRGRPPSTSLVGDWLGGERGRTLYVGRAKNGKLIRCYEKGIQLGQAGSPWVRLEVQFGAVDRCIPHAVLEEPAAAFQGAANWPFKVSNDALSIRTRVEVEAIGCAKLTAEASRAYGKLLNYLQLSGASDGDIVRDLLVAGLPRRLERGVPAWKLRDACNGEARIAANELRDACNFEARIAANEVGGCG